MLRSERKRALVVIFTALDTAPMIEGLLPVLPLLTARHRVVVAGVQDPTVAQVAALPGTGVTADDVHAAAAAQRVLDERGRVHATLARHGVTVVDTSRDMFASRVADVYLTLKAAGRL
jgi:uncharacterized protein (DUF58 family)